MYTAYALKISNMQSIVYQGIGLDQEKNDHNIFLSLNCNMFRVLKRTVSLRQFF